MSLHWTSMRARSDGLIRDQHCDHVPPAKVVRLGELKLWSDGDVIGTCSSALGLFGSRATCRDKLHVDWGTQHGLLFSTSALRMGLLTCGLTCWLMIGNMDHREVRPHEKSFNLFSAHSWSHHFLIIMNAARTTVIKHYWLSNVIWL